MNTENDTFTFNKSRKEIHVIITFWRAQCFVLDLFTHVMLIWLLDIVLWLYYEFDY